MPDIFPGDGGFALFRAFRTEHSAAGGIKLTSLTANHKAIDEDGGYTYGSYFHWQPGTHAAECKSGHTPEPVDDPDWESDRADRVPVESCGCGFWGFKSFKELIRQEGQQGRVFALMEGFGHFIEHETGMRTEFMEIVGFVRPTKEEYRESFPVDRLLNSYPDIPHVSLPDMARTIEARGLQLLKTSKPGPLVQWLKPDGELVWGKQGFAPGADLLPLPIAAKHTEGEFLTVKTDLTPKAWFHGPIDPIANSIGPGEGEVKLRKFRVHHSGGNVYCFWHHMDAPSNEELREYQKMMHSTRDHTRMRVHVEGRHNKDEDRGDPYQVKWMFRR